MNPLQTRRVRRWDRAVGVALGALVLGFCGSASFAQSEGPPPGLTSSSPLPPGYVQRGFGAPAPETLQVPLERFNQGRKVQIWHVQGRVYMLVGAGPNITVQVGDQAVVVVNAGPANMTDEVLSAIHALSNRPLEYIVDTNADADNVSGSSAMSKSGFANSGQPGEPAGAGIVAQLNTLNQLVATPVEGAEIPTDTYADQWSFFNNEAVIVTHAAAAHSNGDSYVFFRRSDVISTGDIFNTDRYPVIETDRGGSIDGILDGLNDIIGIMVPQENEEGGTYLVPAHGRICDRTEIVNYRDALTIIRGRVQFYADKGMSLAQVLAAKPTLDYDGIYGAAGGPSSTRDFIAAVYHDVAAKHGKRARRPAAAESD